MIGGVCKYVNFCLIDFKMFMYMYREVESFFVNVIGIVVGIRGFIYVNVDLNMFLILNVINLK